MKVKVHLGVEKAKDLLANRDCYQVGSKVTRMIDSAVFAGFYFLQKKGKPLTESDLAHISAGIHSSAGVADRMQYDQIPDSIKAKVKTYASTAASLNRKVRVFIEGSRKGDPIPAFTEEDRQKIEASVSKLKAKAEEINAEAEKLCYVEKRVNLALRTVPAKKPTLPSGKKPLMPPAIKVKMGSPDQARTMMGNAHTQEISRPTIIERPTVVEQPTMIERPKTVYPTFSRPALHKSIRRKP